MVLHGNSQPCDSASQQSGPSVERSLQEQILESLHDSKAEEVVSIDLRGLSSMADFMIIASGRSDRHVKAISETLAETLKHEMNLSARLEGKDQGDWVLIDAGDIIVHVFRPEVRRFYQLEKLWTSVDQAVRRS